MEIASFILSLAAIGFSAYAFARQFQLQRKLAAIEQARRDEEVASRLVADVTASVRRHAREKLDADWWLVLVNRGPAVAEDVDLKIEGGMPPELQGDDHSFPITLDAGRWTGVSPLPLRALRNRRAFRC